MRNVPVKPMIALAATLWMGAMDEPGMAGVLGLPKAAAPVVPMRKASDLIRQQEPPKVDNSLEALITPNNSRVLVSLTNQRLWLMMGEQVYIDTPVSTGKRAGMTPTGKFAILEKDPDHRSSIYGTFVDSKNRVVRDGVSLKVDSAPSGTHYIGAPMRWFCRITDNGVGMHVGILPGYPASHGCVRLPAEIAPLIYQKVMPGTPLVIEP
jgi:lipoprotein-anchoring transpeptidase ErfK/SrfK